MLKNIIRIFALVILLIIYSCSLKEPVLPSWFVNLSVPLSEETFTLMEFVNDSTIVVQQDPSGPDSVISVSIGGDLEPNGVSREDLSVELDDVSQSAVLDTLKLDSLQTLETGFNTLRELLPNLDTSSTPVPIPHVTVPFGPDTLSSGDFRGIHLLEGNIRVRIENDLPVPFGPGTVITLYDSLDVITQFSPTNTIYPGNVYEDSKPINNTPGWIYSPIRVDYSLEIIDTTLSAVTDSLLDSTGFSATVSLENIKADSAIIKLPEQDFDETVSIGYEDENKLREAIVDSGSIQLSLANYFPVGVQVFYIVPNIRTQLGDPLSGSITLPPAPASQKDTVINLDGMRIINAANPGEFIDSIAVDITGTTLAPNDYVTISSNDSISVDVQTTTIVFESFKGFFSLDSLEIPEFRERNIADWGDFGPGVFFESVDLFLTLRSQLFIESFDLELDIVGYHVGKNGVTTSATLHISQTLSASGDPSIAIAVPIANPDDVASFLSILPTSMTGSGHVSINGEVEIEQGDMIWGDYLFATPMRLEINGLATIEGDVTTFIEKGETAPDTGLTDTLDSEIRDIGDDLQSGSLELELTNHIPVGVSVVMLVSSDLDRRKSDAAFYDTTSIPINDSLEFIKSATIMAPDLDQSGYATTRQTTISLNLTREQLMILTNPPYRVGYALKIDDSQGSFAIRPVDFVRSKGLAKLIVKVEDE